MQDFSGLGQTADVDDFQNISVVLSSFASCKERQRQRWEYDALARICFASFAFPRLSPAARRYKDSDSNLGFICPIASRLWYAH